MSKTIEQLLEEVTEKLTAADKKFTEHADKAMSEAKSAGDLSKEMKASVDRVATEFNALKTIHDKLEAKVTGIEQAVAELPAPGNVTSAQSIGSEVIAFERLEPFAKNIQSGQRLSVPVSAALLSSDLPPNTVEPDRQLGVVGRPRQRIFVRSLIAPGKTSSSAIFYVQQTGFVNAARAVLEGTSKPYSEIEFEAKIQAVATIAHMFKASKQVLDDFKQLASLIDSEARYGLDLAEETEILFGSGTNASLHGIVPQASDFVPAFQVAKQSGIDDLRLAMLQAQLARVPATGHVLHFMDWAKIELQKDELGRYILANPLGLMGPVLWGLPVVPTEIPQFLGKFLTGAFRDAAQLFDREEANVVISTENADDFEKNLISIRAEKRLGLAVKRPEGFIFGAFTAPEAGAGQ
ncbi:phage major capsid protein [Achromobacter denitrificans]|uniref:phage major capsid protein n=1 Tax=Achromobacter denitrificans TaxID=32002 RepID=UPI000B493A0A|nr:phage major capsid protein [Achromobacter denitrificans]